MNIIEALNSMDSMIEYISSNSVESIVLEMITRFNLNITELLRHPMGGYNKDKSSGSYFYCIKDLKNNLNEYKWVYDNLDDKKSKETFLNLMRYRLTTDNNFITEAYDDKYPQYFDKDIIKCTEDEVYLDCGSFTGDTIEAYISNYGKYKMIYGYEPEDANYNKCISNIKKYENVNVRKKGVSTKSNRVYYQVDGGASTISTNETGSYIDVVSLDEDVIENVTFIKMDVECEEINALLGCQKHIKEDKPKLAIAIYHVVSDIWEIPKLIKLINPNYKLYIRHYRYDVAWETIVYAVDECR
ncbi:FkbM family methyltransferase [Terrisporobacter glycolicus]|uniref:FkbM family methyltransferase n=1 Tax=Terrisporobacter glycolicus TaxID=36841 RepID=UPI0034639F8E